MSHGKISSSHGKTSLTTGLHAKPLSDLSNKRNNLVALLHHAIVVRLPGSLSVCSILGSTNRNCST